MQMKKYIPFQLRIRINQIDPRLDFHWDKILQEIFATLSEEDQENIYQQLLVNKKINWDRSNHYFSFQPHTSLEMLVDNIAHNGMKNLTIKILHALDSLSQYTEVLQVADFLESLLPQIDKIDVEENIDLQRTKQLIRTEFIYEAASRIRNLSELKMPKNNRNLTPDIVKSFIIEVFLKQQLLGYWFKVVQPRQLKNSNHALLNDFLVTQHKIRQIEIIQTSQFIFALAPSPNTETNPFSIRRFLTEEYITISDSIYINGAILELSKINDIEHQNFFAWQISRIITIEKSIGKQIFDLVDNIEQHNSKKLIPLLFTEFDSTGLNVEKIIQQRLWDFEQSLSIHILETFKIALTQIAVHEDEYEFLYVNIRQIFGDIINYFKDFQSLPAVMFDHQADLFSGRLTSYLALLKKRRSQIFVVMTPEQWASNNTTMYEPLDLLKKTIRESLTHYKEYRKQIKENERTLESNNSFLFKVFNKKEKLETKVSELKRQVYKLREKAYIDIVKIPKQYSNLIVYLEFEALISINSKERHYAYPVGDNGINRLPILIEMPEDRNLFNLEVLLSTVEFDLSKMNQKWTDS